MATESCSFPSTLDMNKLPIVRCKLNTPLLSSIVEGKLPIIGIIPVFPY